MPIFAPDNLSVSEVSANVFRNWKHFEKKNELNLLDGATSFVETSQAIYPILVGWGLLDHIAEKMNSTLGTIAYIITDSGANRYARRVQMKLEAEGGIRSHLFMMESGEKFKYTSRSLSKYSSQMGK